MNKAHSPINWQNKPSINTPINETNLNKMDNEIGVIDDRVVAMDTSKANSSDVLAMFSNASYNENTGVITFTRANGTTVTIDTKLEKLAVNFSYDATRQKLIITLDDGTTQEVDMSALINEYDFQTSDTVSFTVVNGKVKAEVVDGSITADKLQPNYLADIRVEVAKAEGAGAQADLAKSYAVGGTGTRAGEDIDNAKYYAQRAEAVSKVDIATTAKAGIVKPDGTTITVDADGTIHGQGGLSNVSWNDIDDKPNSFPPSAHNHQVSDITDFPATMPPSAHTHVVTDITDLDKASDTNLGLVKVDGETITIDDNGVISAVGGGSEPIDLKVAEMVALGYVVPDDCPIHNEINGNVLIQKVGRAILGDVLGASVMPDGSGANVVYGSISERKSNNNIYAEGLTTTPIAVQATNFPDLAINGNSNPPYFYVKDTSCTTGAMYKSKYANTYLYYELTTYNNITIDEVKNLKSTVVGDMYSATKSYVVGDYCIYNNMLYKCQVACVGQIPTNTTYWIATSINNELKTKNIVTTTAPTAGETSTYPVGTTIDVIE